MENTVTQVKNSSSQIREFPQLRKVLGEESRIHMPYKPSDFREDGFFSQRGILIADSQRGDMVVGKFEAPYLDYLRRVGFEIPDESHIVNVSPKKSLRNLVREVPILGVQGMAPFFYDEPSPQKIAATQGLSLKDISKKRSQLILEDKVNFRNFALENGLPYIQGGEIYSRLQDESELERMISRVGEENGVVIRATTGAGVNFILHDLHERDKVKSVIDDILKGRGREKDTFLVEPRVNLVSNPNRTAYISENGEIVPLTVSEQLVDNNLGFSGSVFDRTQIPEMTPYLELMGKTLYDGGYRGIFGVDLMKDDRGNIYMVEANVRTNASNYSGEALNRIEAITGTLISRAYMETSQVTGINTFKQLKNSLDGLLFDGRLAQGVFPISPSPLLKGGEVQLLAYGDSQDSVNQIRKEVARKLNSY